MLALDIIQCETTLAEAPRQFDVLLSQIDNCAYHYDAVRLNLDQDCGLRTNSRRAGALTFRIATGHCRQKKAARGRLFFLTRCIKNGSSGFS